MEPLLVGLTSLKSINLPPAVLALSPFTGELAFVVAGSEHHGKGRLNKIKLLKLFDCFYQHTLLISSIPHLMVSPVKTGRLTIDTNGGD